MAYRRGRNLLHVERQHGRLLDYQGDRARVTMTEGGRLLALPAAPFRAAALAPGEWFVIIARRRPGGELAEAPRVQRVTPPRSTRLAPPRLATPAVSIRRGRTITTRR